MQCALADQATVKDLRAELQTHKAAFADTLTSIYMYAGTCMNQHSQTTQINQHLQGVKLAGNKGRVWTGGGRVFQAVVIGLGVGCQPWHIASPSGKVISSGFL